MKYILLISLLVASEAVHADGLAEDGWFCGTREAIFDYQISRNGVRANNFNISERNSFMSQELKVIEFSYSVANRGQQDARLNGQRRWKADICHECKPWF